VPLLIRVLLLFLALGVTNNASAQSRVKLKDVDQRLQRVEKIMDQSLLELLQQIESLKREIKRLRGELEAQAYELDRTKKRNRDLYLDTDQRITTIEKKLTSPVLPGSEVDSDSDTNENASPADNTSGSLDQLPVFVRDVEAPQGLAQPPPASSAELANPVLAASTDNPPGDITADEQTTYNIAFDLLAARQYDDAIAHFGDFLLQFPAGSYADNAWYWQGEALYAQRRFTAAIENFDTVIKTFPDSPKVSDAWLKIGFSEYEQQRYKSARNTLNAVQQDYASHSAGALARQRLLVMNERGL